MPRGLLSPSDGTFEVEHDVDWVTIREPDIECLHTPGAEATTPQQHGADPRQQPGVGPGRGILLAAGGAGLPRRRRLLHYRGGGAEESGSSNSVGYGNGKGQVWAYNIKRKQLRCVFQSTHPLIVDLPDNMTTSRNGTLDGCKDGAGDNFLRGLTQRGDFWDLALDRVVGSAGNERFGDEFAGSTFSPAGRTLFVNIQPVQA